MHSQKNVSPDSAKRRVLIVDDHPIIRHGIVRTLSMEPDLEVAAETSSAAEALAALDKLEADLALIDISLSGVGGIELIKQIRAAHPRLPILVLSMHDESLYALRTLRAGAGGYIMKREAPEALLCAVRKVIAGEIYLSAAISDQVLRKLSESPVADALSAIEGLTDREFEVFQLVGQGQGTRDIAEHLKLSTKTVETHRINIKEKLEIKTAPELIRFAIDWVRRHNPA